MPPVCEISGHRAAGKESKEGPGCGEGTVAPGSLCFFLSLVFSYFSSSFCPLSFSFVVFLFLWGFCGLVYAVVRTNDVNLYVVFDLTPRTAAVRGRHPQNSGVYHLQGTDGNNESGLGSKKPARVEHRGGAQLPWAGPRWHSMPQLRTLDQCHKEEGRRPPDQRGSGTGGKEQQKTIQGPPFSIGIQGVSLVSLILLIRLFHPTPTLSLSLLPSRPFSPLAP